MDVLLISNIVLTIFTGAYVFLTYRLLIENRKANILNQQNTEKQFQIMTAPHLFCNLRVQDNNVTLEIVNSGNEAIYDVDAWTISLYSEYELSVDNFLKQFLQKGKPKTLEADKEGFYGVYDRLVYSIFPSSRKVRASLQLPEFRPDSILILIQYRNTTGVNYSQLYWFFKDFETNSESYRLGSLEPSILIPLNRYDITKKIIFQDSKNMEMNREVQKFGNLFTHCISSGYLHKGFTGVEDRGIWEDLNH